MLEVLSLVCIHLLQRASDPRGFSNALHTTGRITCIGVNCIRVVGTCTECAEIRLLALHLPFQLKDVIICGKGLQRFAERIVATRQCEQGVRMVLTDVTLEQQNSQSLGADCRISVPYPRGIEIRLCTCDCLPIKRRIGHFLDSGCVDGSSNEQKAKHIGNF